MQNVYRVLLTVYKEIQNIYSLKCLYCKETLSIRASKMLIAYCNM